LSTTAKVIYSAVTLMFIILSFFSEEKGKVIVPYIVIMFILFLFLQFAVMCKDTKQAWNRLNGLSQSSFWVGIWALFVTLYIGDENVLLKEFLSVFSTALLTAFFVEFHKHFYEYMQEKKATELKQ